MFYSFCKFVLNIFLRLRYKIVVHGNPNLEDTPLIICSNHISNWDPLILAIIFNRPINFMAKKELFTNKLFGNLLKKAGVFPVDRENVNIKTIKYSINLLKDNNVLGIFPEGTRVTEVKEDNMKTGVAMIASRSNADIVPVFIKGEFKFRSKIEVFIRENIKIEQFKQLPKDIKNKEITKEIYEEIYKVV